MVVKIQTYIPDKTVNTNNDGEKTIANLHYEKNLYKSLFQLLAIRIFLNYNVTFCFSVDPIQPVLEQTLLINIQQ